MKKIILFVAVAIMMASCAGKPEVRIETDEVPYYAYGNKAIYYIGDITLAEMNSDSLVLYQGTEKVFTARGFEKLDFNGEKYDNGGNDIEVVGEYELTLKSGEKTVVIIVNSE